ARLLHSEFLPVPLIIHLGDGVMGSHIKLARNDGSKVVGNCPFVIVLPFVKIDEVAGQPKIPSAIGVKTFLKFLLPLGPCLSADFNAFDRLVDRKSTRLNSSHVK